MKNNVKWELNNEIVARHFLKNVSAWSRLRVGARSPLPVPGAPACEWNGRSQPWGPESQGMCHRRGLRRRRCGRGWLGAQLGHVPGAAQQRV